MQQGIKKLQWFEYFKVVFLEILNAGLCRVFANQVTYVKAPTLIASYFSTEVKFFTVIIYYGIEKLYYHDNGNILSLNTRKEHINSEYFVWNLL